MKRYIKSNKSNGSPKYPLETLLKKAKSSFIAMFKRDYTGNPKTSWDNIYDNYSAQYLSYADDEASDFIGDKYNAGEVAVSEILDDFENFITFSDIDDYDY